MSLREEKESNCKIVEERGREREEWQKSGRKGERKEKTADRERKKTDEEVEKRFCADKFYSFVPRRVEKVPSIICSRSKYLGYLSRYLSEVNTLL